MKKVFRFLIQKKTVAFIICLSIILDKGLAQDLLKVTNCPENYTNYEPRDIILIRPMWLDDKTKYLLYDYTWTYKITKNVGDHHVTVPAANFLKPLKHSMQKLVIPSYSLDPGAYIISVFFQQKPTATLSLNPENNPRNCHIKIQAYKPHADIFGGRERFVPPNEKIQLTGSKSFSRNLKNKSLKFEWSCTQIFEPKTFCKKQIQSFNSEFIIPAKFVMENESFVVALKVSDGFESNLRTQEIHVSSQAVALEIQCLENCDSVTNFPVYDKETVFGVNCRAHCRGITRRAYIWSIQNTETKEIIIADFRNDKLIIKDQISSTGKFEVVVRVQNQDAQQGLAKTFLNYAYNPPDIKNCKIIPEFGETLTTKFRFFCNQALEASNLYELSLTDYVLSAQRLVTKGLYPEVLENEFLLPESLGRRFFLKVTQTGAPDVTIELEVDVDSMIKYKRPLYIRNALRHFYGSYSPYESLSRKLESEERGEVLVLYEALAEEILANSHNEYLVGFIENLKNLMIKDLLNISVDNLDDMLKISYTVRLLQSVGKFEDYGNTEICEKLTNKSFGILTATEDSFEIGKKAEILTEDVLDCNNFETPLLVARQLSDDDDDDDDDDNIDDDSDDDDDKKEEEKTVKPKVEIENAVYEETYFNPEEYEDVDEEYFKQLEKQKVGTHKFIKNNFKIAKSFALKTKVSQTYYKNKRQHMDFIVFKNEGKMHARTRFEADGVVLDGPQDFSDDSHVYDLLLFVYFSDLFRWNRQKINVSTNIVSLQMWHTTCTKQVKHFSQPIRITFAVNKLFVPTIYSFSVTVPEGHQVLNSLDLNHLIRVHRVFLRSKRQIRVEFHNLTEEDVFHVVILQNKFPEIVDFINKKTIRFNTTTFLTKTNHFDDVTLIYIGILVDTRFRVKKKNYFYHISLLQSVCISWEFIVNQWKPSCQIGPSNHSFLECNCNEVNVVAGYVENTIPQIQEVWKPDLEMTLYYSCNIIFLTTITAFGLYLIVICFILRRKKIPLYFLADNRAKDLYAYLIRIKTGIKPTAGTTSTVVIKLIGDKSSQPHVLNYPDPALKILQAGGDEMFVLTTQRHLGNLRNIELWFDSSGQGPSWYCKDITVYDMQTRQEWYFKVREALSLILNTSKLTVKPSKKHALTDAKGEKIQIKWSIQIKYHTWAFWRDEPNFSRFKRASVVLSNILLIFVCNIFIVGMPKLELEDAFDLDNKSHFWLYILDILYGWLVAVPVFGLHALLAWCFRFSQVQIARYNDKSRFSFRSTVICWGILVFLIVFSISFLVIFGFWVPLHSSMLWLATSLNAIFFGVFVCEHFFLLFQKNCLNYTFEKDMKGRLFDIWKNVETQRRYLYSKLGPQLLRAYFERQYKPLQRREIKKRRFKVLDRLRVIKDIEELVFFGFYTINLYAMLILINDEFSYYIKRNIENIMKGDYTRSINFEASNDHQDFLYYLTQTFIFTIHPLFWYGNYKITAPQIMADQVNKIVGVVRLRQHRTNPQQCAIPQLMHFLNMSCFPNYESSNAEIGDFGYNWNDSVLPNQLDRLKSVWSYQDSSTITTTRFSGLYATYPGGGYVSYLGRNLKNTLINMKYLLGHHWIDDKSCALFVEFLTYNCNFNMFSSVRLLFEQTAGGYVNKKLSIEPVRMFHTKSQHEILMMVSSGIFIIFVMVLSVKLFFSLMRNFQEARRNAWILLDIAILLQSICFLVISATRLPYLSNYFYNFEHKQYEGSFESVSYKAKYFRYFMFFTIEDVLTMLSLTLIISATLRLWRLLRFGMRFQVFEKTIVMTVVPSLHVILLYHVVLIAFGSAMRLISGSHFPDVSSFRNTERTLITMIFGANEIHVKKWMDFKLTAIGLVFYVGVAHIIFILVLSVVVFSYGQALLICSSSLGGYNIKVYVLEKCKYLPKFMRYKYGRSKAGAKSRLKIQPKTGRLYYKKCTSISTLRLRCMKMLYQWNNETLGERDIMDVMLSVAAFIMFERKSDQDLYFIGKYHYETKICHEYRLQHMAFASNLMLEEEETEQVSQDEPKQSIVEFSKAIKKNLKTLRHCRMEMQAICYKISLAEYEILKLI